MITLAHELLTLATVAAAAAWLLLRFIRRPATCDGCDAPRVRRPTRGIRPAAMKVLHRDAGPR